MAVAEPVSHSLLAHIQKERRQKEKPTSPQIISYRGTAADIIGPDEHVFRINWVGSSVLYARTTITDLLLQCAGTWGDDDAVVGQERSEYRRLGDSRRSLEELYRILRPSEVFFPHRIDFSLTGVLDPSY